MKLPQDVEPLLYTLPEAASLLRYSEKTIRRMIDAGQLIARRVRNRWMIAPSDLAAFVQTLKPSKVKGGHAL